MASSGIDSGVYLRLRSAQSDLEPRDDTPEIGPIAYWVGVIFTMFSPIFALGAYQLKPTFQMALGVLPLMALVLLPRQVLTNLKISLPVVGYVAWAISSFGWAEAPDSTRVLIRVMVLFVVSMSVTAAYLPRHVFINAFLRSQEIIIFITLFAVATSAEARAQVVVNGLEDASGWKGFFVFKNIMSPVIVLSMITVLAFEMNRRVAATFVIMTCILMAGSKSATGTVALVLALGIWYWTGLMSRGDPRQRTTTRVATSLIGLTLFGVALNSVASLVNAFGRDLTFTGRTLIWEIVLPLIGDRPVHGYGLAGPLIDLRSQIALQAFQRLDFHAQHAHNLIFDMLLTLGLVGLGIVLTLVFGTFRAAWGALYRSPRLSRWAICMTIIIFVMGFGEPMFAAQFIGIFAAMRILLMNEAADAAVVSSYRDVAEPMARDL